MTILFWLALVIVFYAYVGYPLLLVIMTLFVRRTVVISLNDLPKVSFIIAAYNEEKAIGKKLDETLNLDYPKEKLEIIVASDASSDNTDKIVKGYEQQGVRLIRQEARKGKTAAQNNAVTKADGDILIFSDATTRYEKNAVRELVKHFADTHVGCVGGVEKFVDSTTKIAKEAGFFWKYELFLRERESRLHSLIGVSGCIFAIRKELYSKLNEGLIEDFALPLAVVEKGYRVIQERKAVAYEEASSDTKGEFKRKSRIVAGGLNVLMNKIHLLNFFRFPLLSFQLVSHKVLRWEAPIWMILLLLSNMWLLDRGGIYLIIGIAQISFYGLALAGYLLKSRTRLPGVVTLIMHFCVINLCALAGIWQFVRGDNRVIWETVRE